MEEWQEFYLEKYGWIPMSITRRPQYFDSKCFFGMTVAPPSWFNRMPHTLILGYTMIDELPGLPEGKPIRNYKPILDIKATNTIPRVTLLIEKVDE